MQAGHGHIVTRPRTIAAGARACAHTALGTSFSRATGWWLVTACRRDGEASGTKGKKTALVRSAVGTTRSVPGNGRIITEPQMQLERAYAHATLQTVHRNACWRNDEASDQPTNAGTVSVSPSSAQDGRAIERRGEKARRKRAPRSHATLWPSPEACYASAASSLPHECNHSEPSFATAGSADSSSLAVIHRCRERLPAKWHLSQTSTAGFRLSLSRSSAKEYQACKPSTVDAHAAAARCHTRALSMPWEAV